MPKKLQFTVSVDRGHGVFAVVTKGIFGRKKSATRVIIYPIIIDVLEDIKVLDYPNNFAYFFRSFHWFNSK